MTGVQTCALPIWPHDHDKKGFFLWFDRQFERMTARYEKGVVAMLKRAGRSMVLYGAIVAALGVAFVLSIAAMLWGHHIGAVQSDAGPIWRQVLAVLYAYGAFLAVMVAAVLLRGPLLAATATKAASKPLH